MNFENKQTTTNNNKWWFHAVFTIFKQCYSVSLPKIDKNVGLGGGGGVYFLMRG